LQISDVQIADEIGLISWSVIISVFLEKSQRACLPMQSLRDGRQAIQSAELLLSRPGEKFQHHIHTQIPPHINNKQSAHLASAHR
jgi:hypothetical protein